MEPGLYVSLSGQLALQQRLDTIANNIANANTPGFRAEGVTFATVLSRQGVAYSATGKTTFSNASGPIVQTGNPLDVAVKGDAYLSVATPGGIVLTRDGRMRVSAAGELETMQGHQLLDAGGAPIRINPAIGEVAIIANGTIFQNGNVVGTLALLRVPPDATLSRAAGGLVADRPAELVGDFSSTGLVQGYIENANVNSLLEVTRLVGVSRAFEALNASLDQSDRKLSEAIKALGEGHR